jgi:hypothetical protein
MSNSKIFSKSLANLKSQIQLLPTILIVSLVISVAIAFASQNTTLSTNVSTLETLEINTSDIEVQNESALQLDLTLENVTNTNAKTNTTETTTEETITVETINETITNETNKTIVPALNETPSPEFQIPSEIILDINIESPQKITRGENLNVRAIVTNLGIRKARNVVIIWKLPLGFEIVLGNVEKNCGDLLSNDSCISEISITTSAAKLGENEIKVVVSYE